MRREGGGLRGLTSQSMSIVVYVHGAQINFGDLTPYLTYDIPNQNYTLASCNKAP
jgi:hypothetical protein